MKDLNYERIAQLVAVSAINKDNSAMTNLGVQEQSLCIKFSDYVKSQIHLNIVEDLYGRRMSEYVQTLNFLCGDRCFLDSAEKVLGYFYSDMANFLVNNPENIKLSMNVDAEFGTEVSVSFEEVKKQLADVLRVTGGQLAKRIEGFKYSFIFDDADSLKDVCEKLDSYTLAAILKAQTKSDKVQKICLEV